MVQSPDSWRWGGDYAFRAVGVINVPNEGDYHFTLGSDDGSQLLIDGTEVVSAPDPRSFALSYATVHLAAGQHSLTWIGSLNGDYVEGGSGWFPQLTTGISMNRAAGVRITNGEIRGIFPGIDIRSSSDLDLSGLRFAGNVWGTQVSGDCHHVRVRECSFSQNGIGCRLSGRQQELNGFVGIGLEQCHDLGMCVSENIMEKNTSLNSGAFDLYDNSMPVVAPPAVAAAFARASAEIDEQREKHHAHLATRHPEWMARAERERQNFERNYKKSGPPATCVNLWDRNKFVTDSEGDGPGAGCIW